MQKTDNRTEIEALKKIIQNEVDLKSA
jgi:hypothetical protein